MNHLSTEILRRRVLSGLCFAAVVLGSGFAAWAQEKALPPGDFISARKNCAKLVPWQVTHESES
jgi:hypothetical protein